MVEKTRQFNFCIGHFRKLVPDRASTTFWNVDERGFMSL
jgi:hypothetical protein